MDINLNQKCTVVLAERGVEALQKYYKDLRLQQPDDYKAGDQYTGQLWEIMHIFGGYTYMGPPPPIKTTIQVEPFPEVSNANAR